MALQQRIRLNDEKQIFIYVDNPVISAGAFFRPISPRPVFRPQFLFSLASPPKPQKKLPPLIGNIYLPRNPRYKFAKPDTIFQKREIKPTITPPKPLVKLPPTPLSFSKRQIMTEDAIPPIPKYPFPIQLPSIFKP